MFAHDLGIDVWETIDAAATKPFGFMRFTPGPGVGGHCLPIDPSYLSWAVERRLGRPFRFVELANDINDHMPRYVVARLERALAPARRRPGRRPACSCSAWPTSATPATPASRRRSASSSSCSARAPRSRVADPHVVEDVVTSTAARRVDARRRRGRRRRRRRPRHRPRRLRLRPGRSPTPATCSTPATAWRAMSSSTSERRPPRRRRACRAGRGCRRRSRSTSCSRCDRAGMLAGVFATKAGRPRRCASPASPSSTARRGAARRRRRRAGGDRGRGGSPADRPSPACTATSPTDPAAVADGRGGAPRRAVRLQRPRPRRAQGRPGELGRPSRRRGGRRGLQRATSPPSLRAVGARAALVGHGVDLDRFRAGRSDHGGRRCACSPSAGWSRRRASTCSSTRWRRSDRPWRLDVVGDGPERGRARRDRGAPARRPRRAASDGSPTPTCPPSTPPPTSSSCRRGSTPQRRPRRAAQRRARGDGQRAARWSPATSPPSPPPSATASPGCSCRRSDPGALAARHRPARPPIRRGGARLGRRGPRRTPSATTTSARCSAAPRRTTLERAYG